MTLESPMAMRGFQYKHGDRPLEGFTIQRGAGRGGFGEVYYALSDSGREVALKLLHTYEQIELRGVSQCMNLKSPQLVTIFDVKYGEDGRPWVIMEFVSGPSLRELIDAAPSGLGTDKSAFFLREIGKGLTYLHDCGIVHRDLKPGNIFYENGLVKIGDYGLSKTISMSQHSGQTVTVGTLHYMAPEIGEGKYDRSIDIYALGALVFEMLTGQVPFYGSSPAEVLMKHLSAEVNLERVEEPFKSVIRKAMAKNPADRYQSVQEMVEAVFGSEHIRNSVSQFSPQSLTMVAGRVAENIGGGGKSSTNPYPPQDRQHDKWQRLTDRFGQRMFRFGARVKDQRDQWTGNTPEDLPAEPDRIRLPARIFLALLATFIAAVAAMIDSSRGNPDEAAFVFFAVAGAVIGVKLAWWLIAPAIAGESSWMKRFALGAPAGFGAALLTLPIWADSYDDFGHRNFIQSIMVASFLSMLLLDWADRLKPSRKERFSIGHLICAAIVGLILAGMFGVNPVPVIATVAGASLASSLLAYRGGKRPARQTGRAQSPNAPPPRPAGFPPFPNAPMPNVNSPGMNSPGMNPPATSPSPFAQVFGQTPLRPLAPLPLPGDRIQRLLLIFVIFFLAAMSLFFVRASAQGGPSWLIILIVASFSIFYIRRNRRGKMSSMAASSVDGSAPREPVSLYNVASSVAHGILGTIASILLWASLVIAFAVVIDLPGLMATGVFDPQLPRDLERGFGTPEWPRVMLEIGTAASFIIAMPALAFMTFVRRRGGVLYMIRGLLGAGILFGAVAAFGHEMCNWSGLHFTSHNFTPAPAIDYFFQHVYVPHLLGPAMIAMIGVVVLLWPAGRNRQRTKIAAATTSSPTTTTAPIAATPFAAAAPNTANNDAPAALNEGAGK